MVGTIEIVGMKFFSRHGVYAEEREKGNDFVVDFRGETDMTAAIESDSLCDTVDYQRVQQIVASEMEVSSLLLEHVAGRIINRLKSEFPELLHASVSVSKMNPPMSTPSECSKVTLSY